MFLVNIDERDFLDTRKIKLKHQLVLCNNVEILIKYKSRFQLMGTTDWVSVSKYLIQT